MLHEDRERDRERERERENCWLQPSLPSDKNDDGCDDGSQEDEPSEHSQSDYSS